MRIRDIATGLIAMGVLVCTASFGQTEFRDREHLQDVSRDLTYCLSRGMESIGNDTTRFLSQRPSLLEKLEHVVWVKGTFMNTSQEPIILGVRNATIDSITVYLREGINARMLFTTGDKFPYARRMHDSEYFLFDLPQAASAHTFYLKVKVKELTQIPVFLGTQRAWVDAAQRDDIGVAIFFGGILILVVYNLFICIATRELNYVIYAMANMSALLLILTLDGYSFRYFWPESSWLNDAVPSIAAANSFIYCLFFISFTNLKVYEPGWRNFFFGMLALFSLIIPLNVVTDSFFASMVYQLVAIPYIFIQLYVVFRVIRKGYTPAKYFFLGSCLYSTGGFLFILYNLNLLPIDFAVGVSLKVSLLLEACLLSFALADKLNYLKNENIRITLESNKNLAFSNTKLKDALESLDLFVYRSAHDIRGPLMRLKGLINLFSIDNPRDQGYMEKLRWTADNLESILDKHIVLNSLKNYRVNVGEVNLEELLKRLSRELSLDDLSVRLEVDQGLIMRTDEHLLSVILKELLLNSKLFQQAKIPLCISISVRKEGDMVHFRITDNGTGIDESIHGRIYEVFFRGSSLSQGSGVGLTIASQATRLLQGSLTLKESQLGLTVFDIRLPVSVPALAMVSGMG